MLVRIQVFLGPMGTFWAFHFNLHYRGFEPRPGKNTPQ